MFFDGLTVAAQILNFVILLALLRKFLYGPILRAMDEREEKLQKRQQEAEELNALAHEEAKALERKNQELDEARDELMARAREEADEERKKLFEDLREEVERSRREWHRSLEEEKKSFLKELSRLAGRETIAISARVLKELSDTDLDERVVEVFLKRLRSAKTGSGAGRILEEVRTGEQPVTIISARPLPDAARHKIRRALSTELDVRSEVSFEVDPELVLGVRLVSEGREIGIDLKEYLESIESVFLKTLEEESKPGDEDRKIASGASGSDF